MIQLEKWIVTKWRYDENSNLKSIIEQDQSYLKEYRELDSYLDLNKINYEIEGLEGSSPCMRIMVENEELAQHLKEYFHLHVLKEYSFPVHFVLFFGLKNVV